MSGGCTAGIGKVVFMTQDEIFMREAISQARAAAETGDVPVGAVVVYRGEIIARGCNMRERDRRATAHAELIAIEEACRVRGGWRLFDCELYVTLEPCIMCAGAVINARINRIIYGARDLRFGALGSLFDANSLGLNHKLEVTGGVLEDECRELLRSFFRSRRQSSGELQ